MFGKDEERARVEDPVKVAVACGYSVEANVLQRVLGMDAEVRFVGLARNGDELLPLVAAEKPNAILLDIETFTEDAIDTVRQIMAEMPTPIILLSSKQEKTERVFEAISAGALTVLKKPALVDLEIHPDVAADLLRHIKMFSKVKVIKHVSGRKHGETKSESRAEGKDKIKIVAIASSTGGPQALRRVLAGLPEGFPAGIVIAQHITQGFAKGLAEWLDSQSRIKVRHPVDKERIKAGVAYIAPDGHHILVDVGSRIMLQEPKQGDHYVPSGNMLLASAAEVFGSRAIGVILSGMGDDGVKGLQAIAKKGGKTIAQDEDTCVVFGMPRVALEKGAVKRTTPLARISWEILREF